jgi:hypothetical protein
LFKDAAYLEHNNGGLKDNSSGILPYQRMALLLSAMFLALD